MSAAVESDLSNNLSAFQQQVFRVRIYFGSVDG